MKRARLYIILSAVVVAGVVVFLVFRGNQGSGSPADENRAGASPSTALSFIVHEDTIEVPDEAIKAAGLLMIEVRLETLPQTLSLSGKTGLDMERVAHVHAQFPGKVVQVVPQLGDGVKGPESTEGATQLCVIESTDLAGAKSDYLKAQVQLKLDQDNLDRTEELVKSTVLAEKFLLDAHSAVTKDAADVDATRQRLKVFGLSDSQIESVARQQGRERMDYAITSPLSGVIAEKSVTGGEIADPTINLFTIADTSKLWVWGDAYERDRPLLNKGQKMQVILTSAPDHPRETTVDWISPVLDATTRSIRIRAVLDNTDNRPGETLLADMYATLLVTVADGKDSIIVPADAVVRKQSNAFVFVLSNTGNAMTVFQRRAVEVQPLNVGPGLLAPPTIPEASAVQRLRVVKGLSAGDRIVSNGALGLFNEMETQGR